MTLQVYRKYAIITYDNPSKSRQDEVCLVAQTKNRRKKYETCKNIKHKKVTKHGKKGRVRRMPDVLPVGV